MRAWSKKLNKGIPALLALMILLAGCSPAASAPTNTPIQAKATPTAQPTVAAEQVEPTKSPDAEATQDPELADEYRADELTGIAEASDVLPPLSTYEEAKALNEDVVGWITIPGTSIDYPVVRCDNNEYYLGRNVEKQKSRYGSIFMDFRNAESDQQKHIILYGHNMKNGTMFHDLMNYKQKDFFDEYKYIYFLWDGTETVWEVYLATIVPSTDGYTVNYIATRFADDNNFATYMAEMIAYANTVSPSIIDTSVVISSADQVLTLSTCTYEYDNSRFAVQARRIK